MPKYDSSPIRLFSALGDPTRLAVVERLCQGPLSVSELAAPFKMALPTFTQHLRVLEDAGWILTQKEGRVRTCRINPDALLHSGSWLNALHAAWEKRLDRLDTLLYKLKTQEEKKP